MKGIGVKIRSLSKFLNWSIMYIMSHLLHNTKTNQNKKFLFTFVLVTRYTRVGFTTHVL